MTDEAAQLTAVKEFLTTAQAFPYSLGDLSRMAVPPKRYTEVTVSRVFGGEARVDGFKSTTSWRITTRAVAMTEDDAREIRRRASTLELAVLGDSTPVEFETAQDIEPDDGWYSGLTTWTYTT